MLVAVLEPAEIKSEAECDIGGQTGRNMALLQLHVSDTSVKCGG